MNRMPFSRIHLNWSEAPSNVAYLSTERAGGVSHAPYDDGQGGGGLNLGLHVGDNSSHVLTNRSLLDSVLPSEPIWLTQVHGNKVIDADAMSKTDMHSAPEADAIVTSTPQRICAIQTADCLPVLFCSMDGKVVGAAHAGWRGLATGVLQNTIHEMRRKGVREIAAWLGPAIGPHMFEVGQDVFDAFGNIHAENLAAFRRAPDGKKYFADIYLLAKMALQREGVSRTSGGDFCTVTEGRRFYSYRRDCVTGRMASIIWME